LLLIVIISCRILLRLFGLGLCFYLALFFFLIHFLCHGDSFIFVIVCGIDLIWILKLRQLILILLLDFMYRLTDLFGLFNEWLRLLHWLIFLILSLVLLFLLVITFNKFGMTLLGLVILICFRLRLTLMDCLVNINRNSMTFT
jgi:hypothetical protein